MALIEVSTWKTSQRFISQDVWRNRWLVNVPFAGDADQVLNLMDTIVRCERQVHMNHVLYKQATSIEYANPGDGEGKKAQIFYPTGENSVGQQENPLNIAPDNFALCVRKEVERGYLGKWFFFGCLKDSDYVTSQKGNLHLINPQLFSHLMETWIETLYNQHLAVLQVPQGLNRYGVAYDYVNVNMLQALSVTKLKASPRKQAKVGGIGIAVKEYLNEQANIMGLWMNQIRDWLAFNHDFVPTDVKERSISILTDAYGAIKQAGKYAENKDSQTGQALAEPVFRWQPIAGVISGIAGTASSAKTMDIEDISKRYSYTFADNQEYFTNEDAQYIYSKLQKWQGWLAELIRADWTNPVNSQVGQSNT